MRVRCAGMPWSHGLDQTERTWASASPLSVVRTPRSSHDPPFTNGVRHVLVFRQNPLDGIETAVEDLDPGSERETDKVMAWRVEEVSLERGGVRAWAWRWVGGDAYGRE